LQCHSRFPGIMNGDAVPDLRKDKPALRFGSIDV
jgi:hypothetical protein